MPRLFVALDLPLAIRETLASMCSGVAGAKWVKRDQMHLTLRFIGEVDDRITRQIREALDQVHRQPFSLSLRGVGQFPPRGAPRVLWVGLDAPPELLALYRQIEAALTALGLPPEDRPFSAHITLGRLKTPPPPEAVRQFMRRHADFATAPISMTEFVLYSSVLAPHGPTYHAEGRYPLTPSMA